MSTNKKNKSEFSVITTPMCRDILVLAGISDFRVTYKQDYANADFAIVLSETKTRENSNTNFIKIKLNTFSQIETSIKKVKKVLNTQEKTKEFNENLINAFKNKYHYKNDKNRKIKVKVYSDFLKDIIIDMGFDIIDVSNYDYLVYPDYMKTELCKEIKNAGEKAIELPSHKNAPLNPIERAKIRYQILEKNLCTNLIGA